MDHIVELHGVIAKTCLENYDSIYYFSRRALLTIFVLESLGTVVQKITGDGIFKLYGSVTYILTIVAMSISLMKLPFAAYPILFGMLSKGGRQSIYSMCGPYSVYLFWIRFGVIFYPLEMLSKSIRLYSRFAILNMLMAPFSWHICAFVYILALSLTLCLLVVYLIPLLPMLPSMFYPVL